LQALLSEDAMTRAADGSNLAEPDRVTADDCLSGDVGEDRPQSPVERLQFTFKGIIHVHLTMAEPDRVARAGADPRGGRASGVAASWPLRRSPGARAAASRTRCRPLALVAVTGYGQETDRER
jgi:hypothetical protein